MTLMPTYDDMSAVALADHPAAGSRRPPSAFRLTIGRFEIDAVAAHAAVLVIASGLERLNVPTPVGRFHLGLFVFAASAVILFRRPRMVMRWHLAAFAILVAALVPSAVHSVDPIRSAAAFVRLFICYGFVALSMAELYARDPAKTIAGVMAGLRLSAAVLAVQYLTKQNVPGSSYGGSRFHLFFFEPSYLSFAFAPLAVWTMLSLAHATSNLKSCLWIVVDVTCLVVLLAATQSMFVAAAVGVALGVTVLTARIHAGTSVFRLAAMAGAAAIACLIAVMGTDGGSLAGKTARGLWRADDKIDYLIRRSQGRFPSFETAVRIGRDHPIRGIGFGAYQSFTERSGRRYLKHAQSSGGRRLLVQRRHGSTAVNVLAGTFAESGVIGLSGFTLAAGWLLLAGVAAVRDPDATPITAVGPLALIVQAALLMAEANPYRAYVWTTVGLAIGAIAARRVADASPMASDPVSPASQIHPPARRSAA